MGCMAACAPADYIVAAQGRCGALWAAVLPLCQLSCCRPGWFVSSSCSLFGSGSKRDASWTRARLKHSPDICGQSPGIVPLRWAN